MGSQVSNGTLFYTLYKGIVSINWGGTVTDHVACSNVHNPYAIASKFIEILLAQNKTRLNMLKI